VWWAGGAFNAPLGWVARDGGEPTWLRDAEPAIEGVALRGDDVYWLVQGMGEYTGELRGIESGRFRTLASGFFMPGSLHLVDGHFYFADGTNSGSIRDEGRGRALRVAEGGGDAQVLVEGLALPRSVAVGPANLYWVDLFRGQLGRVPRAGGAAEILLEGLNRPTDLSLFDGALYFAADGMVLRTDLDGRAVETVADLGAEIRGLLVTDVGLFGELWDGSVGTSSLVWAPPNGDPPEVVEAEGRAPVADATRIYWTVGGVRGGVIRGACKDHFRAR
jgi:hypothetical protein